MNRLANGIELTKDDTLKNILIMAPLLDEAGQNKVFGLMCGLMSGSGEKYASNENRTKAAG